VSCRKSLRCGAQLVSLQFADGGLPREMRVPKLRLEVGSNGMNRLDGKVTLISGAARGIGGETARLMASAGASVVVGDVLDERGRETVATMIAAGAQAEYAHLDVAREQDWTAAINLAVDRFGKLDILVNNAGVFIGKGIEEISLDEWNRLVAVNMTGVFLGTKLAAPALREAAKSSEHGSAIVNLASIAGLVGSQLDPLYSMTRAALLCSPNRRHWNSRARAIGSASTQSIPASFRRIWANRPLSRAHSASAPTTRHRCDRP
jgi:NADP-dependent 3-hydroxy acid dehydrogenase YdfG